MIMKEMGRCAYTKKGPLKDLKSFRKIGVRPKFLPREKSRGGRKKEGSLTY